MKITHMGHSAVLVETGRVRILIDPGNFSSAWHDLTDVDAILVTHAHPDHVDPQQVPALVAKNPTAKVLVEPGVLDGVGIEGARILPAGDSISLGDVRIDAVGGSHALIHRDIPRIGNVGFVVTVAGGSRFFHPGDALDTVPDGVDIAAIPAHGPWCAMKEIIDFARALGASRGFLIHDGLVNDRGWALSFSRLNEMTPVQLTDLRDGRPVTW